MSKRTVFLVGRDDTNRPEGTLRWGPHREVVVSDATLTFWAFCAAAGALYAALFTLAR